MVVNYLKVFQIKIIIQIYSILAISQEYGAVPREMIDYKISVTDKSIESYKSC